MKRLAEKIWRDCVEDERKLTATYRRIAKELEELGFPTSAETLRVLVGSEETHMSILNEIIFFLNQRIQIEEEEWRRPKEAIEVSRKYAGITGTVTVRYENGSIHHLPRRNYLMMRDAGRDVTLVS